MPFIVLKYIYILILYKCKKFTCLPCNIQVHSAGEGPYRFCYSFAGQICEVNQNKTHEGESDAPDNCQQSIY